MKKYAVIFALVIVAVIAYVAVTQFSALMVSREEINERSSIVQRTIDLDGDGALTAAEIAGASAALATLDSNGDGELTPDESHGGLLPLWDLVRVNWAFNFIDDDGDVTISAIHTPAWG